VVRNAKTKVRAGWRSMRIGTGCTHPPYRGARTGGWPQSARRILRATGRAGNCESSLPRICQAPCNCFPTKEQQGLSVRWRRLRAIYQPPHWRRGNRWRNPHLWSAARSFDSLAQMPWHRGIARTDGGLHLNGKALSPHSFSCTPLRLNVCSRPSLRA